MLKLTDKQAQSIKPSELLALFRETWPEAFGSPRLLKIGITHDIAEDPGWRPGVCRKSDEGG
jgi:hypothetical protein